MDSSFSNTIDLERSGKRHQEMQKNVWNESGRNDWFARVIDYARNALGFPRRASSLFVNGIGRFFVGTTHSC